MPRFFIDDSQVSDEKIIITGNDAHHISYSLRMRVGEKIVVCDTKSIEYKCEIISFSQDKVEAKIISSNFSSSESPYNVTVYQAIVKGDKFDTVVQKAVETGAYRVVPFESSRCVVKFEEKSLKNKNDRWNRIAQEASKQCGRGRIVEVGNCLSFDAMLNEASKDELAIICYENEDKTTLKQVLNNYDGNGNISIIVGPEGGFSIEEIEKSKEKGIKCCGLGKRILRTETAAMFVLSCLTYEYEL